MTQNRIEVLGPAEPGFECILTDDALRFLTVLHDRFAGRRHELLAARMDQRRHLDNGRDLRFLSETRAIREDPSWRVAGAGPGLEDRRVEITGPTDRKMTINAMNSGARVWLADLEDATSPTWHNVVDGQVNLRDAIRREISHTAADGRRYELGESTPTIVMRPRGWHLVEKHLRYTDAAGQRGPASGSLVDFGLYAFHNARELIARGAGPYFYLPKLENHREARLWDDVFTFTENALRLDHGTIRATVLIETIGAAFEMEEILYELRDHCAGLNAGRWDYLFSIIKSFRTRPGFVLPDRARLTMAVPFMRAYTEQLVRACHRRGAHAIGGMSAFIPDRRDAEATATALERVAEDKRREARDGFDGSWVAHPGLVPTAMAEFDAVLGSRPNQVDRLREDVEPSARALVDLAIEDSGVTDEGVRRNASIALRYIEAWLRGTGAVAIDGLMEDAATAEISRGQLWQWIRHRVVTAEGRLVTRELVETELAAALAAQPRHPDDRFDEAARIVREVCLEESFPTFLTIGAYSRHLVDESPAAASRAA